MGLTLQESIDLKNRIDALSEYHAGVDYLSLKKVLYKLVDEIAEAGDGGGTIDASGVDVIPFVVVSSGDINSAYRYYDDYDGKPRYVQVIPGTTQADSAAASNFIWWITGDSKWHVWGNGGAEYHTSADDVATPDLITKWVLADGATAPLPTVTQYSGPTAQDAVEQVAANRGPKEFFALVTQAGSDAPTLDMGINTIGTATSARGSSGQYSVAFPSGSLPQNKTRVWIDSNSTENTNITFRAYWEDTQTVRIYSDNGDDAGLTNIQLNITVFP